MSPVEVKPRSRAGAWSTFERRYESIDGPDGSPLRDHKDIPPGTDPRRVWTVVDCDGTLYVVPGFRTVNYMGRVVTVRPWSDVEESNPGYRY